MSSERSLSSLAIVEGNDDLLIEILLVMPAKSLVRFKLVSKRWRLLISAPSFCRLHTLRLHRRLPQTQPLFILGFDYYSKYLVYNPSVRRLFSLPFPCGISRVHILQSCNGLILLSCRKQEERYSWYYYVFNPTTKQQRDLSPLPFTSVAGIYLMFDPSISPHYRVVCFASAKANALTLIYVYDSETHKWKLGRKCSKKATNFCNGIYFNGGIYFVGRFFSRCFQPDNNVSEIPNPPRLDAIGFQRDYAVESNGILLSLTLYEKQGSNLLIVSEMKKDEKRWTKKYEADMNPILATCARDVRCRAIRLLCMVRGEKEEDSLLMLTFDKKVMIYRFYDNSFEVLLKVKQRFEDAHLLIHSLAPV